MHVVLFGVAQRGRTNFAPVVFLNGKSLYTTIRNTKTARGGLSRAQRWADDVADDLRRFGNPVTISKWMHSII